MRKAIVTTVVLVTILLSPLAWTSGSEGGFTKEDRERLIRVETTLKVFMEQVDKRLEQVDKRFEQIDKRFEQIDKRFEQIDKRFEQIDKRFEQVDKRFEDLRQDMNKRFEQVMNFLWILSGIFTTLVVAVIGFGYWDRRTIIRRARDEAIEAIEREGRLRDVIYALRELAKEDEKLAQLLRSFGLL